MDGLRYGARLMPRHRALPLPVLVLAGVAISTACSTTATTGGAAGPDRPAAATEPCLEPAVRTLGALEAGLARFDGSGPRTPDEACRLALLLVRSGRLERAREVLGEILAREPERLDALLLLRQVHRRQDRDDEADALLDRAAALAPANLRVRLLLAAREDEGVRDSLYEALLEHYPESVDTWVAAGRARLGRDRTDSARAALERALVLDSMDVSAWLLQARIHRRDGNDARALRALERAVATDSLSVDAQLALARRRRADVDLEGAFRRYIAVLRFDPYNAGVHRTLGNGGSIISWGRYPPLADDEVPPDLARALDEADGLLLRRDLDRAEAAYRRVLASYPGYASARLGLASVYYHRREYEAALEQFVGVARDHPGLGLAHYGASQSLRRLRERNDPRVRAAAERFDRIPRPREPEGLREVFPDFERVDADLQKIILLSVAPLSHYVKVLAIGGATFQLIPFHERLWEIPHNERNRGRRTFDLRLWDDVKGQGGFHASAGEAWVREVKQERFNVLAHEFMHQVHSMFTEEQRREVERLFRRAKRMDRTLDSYADYNEMEYLAQAYEAWISPRKAPGTGGTGGHTRAEVEALDPDVVRFLETVNVRESYRENEVIAYRQRMRNLIGEGELEAAERAGAAARERYGDDPELLPALARVARLQGDYERAEALDARAVTLFPDRIRGYLGLAEDLAEHRHDHADAAAAVARYLDGAPWSDEAWLELAGHRLAAGDYGGAERALAKADSLLGKSNPEARYFSLRAELALVRGDTAVARQAYEHTIRTISRRNIPGWTALGAMAVAEGNVERAATILSTARAIDAAHPRVRELAAVVLDAQGRTAEALDTLVALRRHDPRRLETLTELVTILGREDPERASPYVEAGRRLIEAAEPVSHVYERDRFVARGRLTAPAVERFRAAVRMATAAEASISR